MSLFIAAIKRCSAPSLFKPNTKVCSRTNLSSNSRADTEQLITGRAMHIQSIPMCKSTLMETSQGKYVVDTFARGGDG